MDEMMKTTPAVFAVDNTYQIMVPVHHSSVMWVRVGEKCFYDASNGVLRSDTAMHRCVVPMDILDAEKEYTVCYRKMLERKPGFSVTEDIVERTFSFYPVTEDKITVYHIADAHYMVDAPVAAAKAF